MKQAERDAFKNHRQQRAFQLRNAQDKKRKDKAIGYFLEDLVLLALENSGYWSGSNKTHGLDLKASHVSRIYDRIAVEATNWDSQSKDHPDYFKQKVAAFHRVQSANYECLWVLTYHQNFPPIPCFIHTIEIKKQMRPARTTLKDYRQLRELIVA